MLVAVASPHVEEGDEQRPSQEFEDEGGKHEEDEGGDAEEEPPDADKHGREAEKEYPPLPGPGPLPQDEELAQPPDMDGRSQPAKDTGHITLEQDTTSYLIFPRRGGRFKGDFSPREGDGILDWAGLSCRLTRGRGRLGPLLFY